MQSPWVGGPLEFAFWNVHEATVRDNLDRFCSETGIPVLPRVIDGDFFKLLNAEFAAGAGPEVFYAQRAEAAYWGQAGIIAPLDPTHAILSPLVARMDDRMVAGAQDPRGRLLGLTYYNGGPFALFFREDIAHDIASWRDLLDLLRRAKRDGLSEYPFVPRWHRTQTGLVWSVLCHLATEGVISLFEADAVAALEELISLFHALVGEQLVPPDCLDDKRDLAALKRWATGRHVATFTMDYLAADTAKLAGRRISVPIARLPGRYGTPLMPGHALLCLRQGLKPTRAEAALRLLAFLGGVAADGDLAVHRRWLREHLFAVPYPELEEDAQTIEAVARFFPIGSASLSVDRLRANRQAAVVSPISHAPFMLDWSERADLAIRGAMRDPRGTSPGTVADKLIACWHELADQHS